FTMAPREPTRSAGRGSARSAVGVLRRPLPRLVPRRERVDPGMSLLFTAGPAKDPTPPPPPPPLCSSPWWPPPPPPPPPPRPRPPRGWRLHTISELRSLDATRDCLDSPWFLPIVKQLH